MGKVLIGNITGPKGDEGDGGDLDAVLGFGNTSDLDAILELDTGEKTSLTPAEILVEKTYPTMRVRTALGSETFEFIHEDLTDGVVTDTTIGQLTALGLSDDRHWSLPDEDGMLALEGSFSTFVRDTVSLTTASLAAGARHSGVIDMATGYEIIRVTVDLPARVRLYATTAARDADVSRAIGTDPDWTTDHGVYYDRQFPTASGRYATPPVPGFTDGTTVSVPILIDNLDTVARAITVTIIFLRTE
jgi:hypothetical protein